MDTFNETDSDDVYEYQEEESYDEQLFKSDSDDVSGQLANSMGSLSVSNSSRTQLWPYRKGDSLDVSIAHNGYNMAVTKDAPISTADYLCLTDKELYEMIEERAGLLKQVLDLSLSSVIVLLQKYNLDEERLIEEYTENAESVLKASGLQGNESQDKLVQKHIRSNFSCFICCELYDSVPTFSLHCGHEYCLECYRRYVKDKIHAGKVINCMGCDLALKDNDIDEIMGDSGSSSLHMLSSIRTFIQSHSKNYKRCPDKDCEYIIYLPNNLNLVYPGKYEKPTYVTCYKNHRFCFNCSLEVHEPCDCTMASIWVKKAQTESENLNLVLRNIKACPKCKANIEKDGGCNHLKCGNCSHEFCWVCEEDWNKHSNGFYQCLLYDGEKKHGKGTHDELIGSKYSHYYKAFGLHESSIQLDMKLGHNIQQKTESMQYRLGLSSIECQFVPDAVRLLITSRNVLKWSFAFAYFLDRSHNMCKIFEQHQMELAKLVEDLAQLLVVEEMQEILPRKKALYDISALVEKRTRALVGSGEDLIKGNVCMSRIMRERK
ncbi:HBR428Cp [Eremothecium sinecaudum]|uniref:RBR-type E3 ubiquitin transferase n=1 Tax=Eremothecium sinecaudum TaxID=45286 RepID=A0A109UXJ1_9SACH|nr:HBR428Cp [Eremothecium sinecaudum]AMD19329.1 HBR428Cp [Eremothecium sinecaudum]